MDATPSIKPRQAFIKLKNSGYNQHSEILRPIYNFNEDIALPINFLPGRTGKKTKSARKGTLKSISLLVLAVLLNILLNIKQATVTLVPLSFYAFSGLLNFVSTLGLATLILVKNPRAKTNRLFALWSLLVAQWSLFYFFWMSSTTLADADFHLRTLMIGASLMPAVFLDFACTFLKIPLKPWLRILNHSLGIFFFSTLYTPLFVTGFKPLMLFPYWPIPGPVMPFQFIHFGGNVVIAHALMIRALGRTEGVFHQQIQFMCFGTLIGYLGGGLNYLPWFGVEIPPLTTPLVSLYVASVGYGIIRHKLLEMDVIVKRTVVFTGLLLMIFAIVGAVSFWLPTQLIRTFGFEIPSFWLNLLSVSIVAATFNHMREFLASATDRYLFQKKPDYRLLFKRFSDQAMTISDLRQLEQMTVMTVFEIMKVKGCGLWLHNQEEDSLYLEAARGQRGETERMTSSHPAYRYLKEKKKPFALDMELGGGDLPPDVRDDLSTLQIRLVLPLTHQEEMIGALTLGGKKSDEDFTDEDLDVLQPLCGTLAIAVTNARLFSELAKKEVEASTDDLTGLLVRRAFLQKAGQALWKVQQNGQACTLLMVDLDNFKEKNDTHGHLIGDLVLMETAHRMTRSLRADDLVGRYGGEEFIFLLPLMNKENGRETAERIRMAVTERVIRTDAGHLQQTVSIGVAIFPQDASTLQDLIAAADSALYEAKRKGRDRVATFG